MRNRAGIALFAALALTAIASLLVAGAFATATLSARSARMGRDDALLSAAADYGLSTALSTADSLDFSSAPLGAAQSLIVPLEAEPALNVAVTVTRLPAGLLWLVSSAVLRDSNQSRRSFNLVVRFPMTGPIPRAPIMARGEVRLGSGVAFSSSVATDADCDRVSQAEVILSSAGALSSVDSVRAVTDDAANDANSYYLSPQQIAGLDSAGRVVHVRGDTTLVGGAFDGFLLVDGSITITGPFRATGLIVSRERVVATSGGFSLTGALLSFAPPGSGGRGGRATVELADAAVSYAPCEVARVLRRAIPPRPVRKRGWAEIF